MTSGLLPEKDIVGGSRTGLSVRQRYRRLHRQPKPSEVRDDVGGLTVAVKVERQRNSLTIKVHFQRDLADAPLAPDAAAKAFAFTPVADRAR